MTQAKTSSLAETVGFAGTVASGLVALAGIVLGNAPSASAGTAGLAATLYLTHGTNQRGRIERLEADTRRLGAELGQSQGESANFGAEVARLKADNQKLWGMLQPYRMPDGTLLEPDGLRTQIQRLTQDVDSTASAMGALKDERDAIAKKLSEASEALRLEKDNYGQSVAVWTSQFDDQNAEIVRLEAEVSRLTVELKTHQEHKDLLVYQQSHSVMDKLRETVERLQAIEAGAKEMGVDLVKYHAAFAEVNATLNELQGDVYDGVKQAHNDAIGGLVAQLQALQSQLKQALSPQKFQQSGEYARADKLIDLLWANGYAVDANEITPGNDGSFGVALNVREREKLCQAYTDELTKLGDFLATQCNALEPLSFELDRVNPFRVTTTIRYARKPKSTAKDVSKLWRTADQFVSTVSKWQRIRITGGSESGKSPLAELIIAAILQRHADSEVLLAFPIANSRKNHWTLPVTHTSVMSLAETLIDKVDARAKGKDKSNSLVLGVMDECDTALASDSTLAPKLKELLKTGSHTAVGVVLVGQNANATNYKGFQRSDFENCVNVHIGANCYHAISNSALSEDEQRKLKDKADKLTRYCEAENADLDGEADSDKLERFALVLEPNKAGYFIQLPRFGSMVPQLAKSVLEPSPTQVETVNCPHCKGSHYSKNGTTVTGLQRYRCKNSACRKSFTLDA